MVTKRQEDACQEVCWPIGFVLYEENARMDLFAVAEGMNTMGFPLLAILAMFASKLSVGPSTRIVDRLFIVAFALQTILTARTVIHCDDAWLLHMFTVMILIVGSVVIPSLRDTTAEPA